MAVMLLIVVIGLLVFIALPTLDSITGPSIQPDFDLNIIKPRHLYIMAHKVEIHPSTILLAAENEVKQKWKTRRLASTRKKQDQHDIPRMCLVMKNTHKSKARY